MIRDTQFVMSTRKSFSFISKGQILSIPMILAGFLIIYLGYLSQEKSAITDNNIDKKSKKKKTINKEGNT